MSRQNWGRGGEGGEGRRFITNCCLPPGGGKEPEKNLGKKEGGNDARKEARKEGHQ
jgi:hypothetical protein